MFRLHHKHLPTLLSISFLFLGLTPFNIYAESSICKQLKKITFITNPIFDKSDDDYIFIHDWANFFHIDTKQITLKNEAAFFLQRCDSSEENLAELERHFRQRKFIRDAKVNIDKENKITVETWDNWSLMPTADYGRKGGENEFSIGIKDRNLLGLGIDAEVEYFTNAQNSGYKFDTEIPLFLDNNAHAALTFIDSDDGELYSVFFNKGFVSHDTNNAYNIGFLEAKNQTKLFQNGKKLTRFNHDTSYKNIQWGWLSQDNHTNTLRFYAGLTQEEHTFTTLSENSLVLTDNNKSDDNSFSLPSDRSFTYPWLGFGYQEKQYKKLTNIYLINHTEDFNLGWQLNGHLGLADGNKENSAWTLYRLNISKGMQLSNQSLLIFSGEIAGETYQSHKNRVIAKLSLEAFHELSDQWRLYFKNTNVFSKNQFKDDPISLGGDTSLRGFPLQYQHGENTTLFTSELRYYPQINIFKLFELGGVFFWDVGKASGTSTIKNIDNGWLNSLGIGARFFSTHSSESQVIHLDLAFPISDNDQLNGVEIRAETKYAF
ncbi:MAG: hypothetical protein HRT52_14110 [Colwellia sp.]|nr:hypothetical protein [Colwellia sp.]